MSGRRVGVGCREERGIREWVRNGIENGGRPREEVDEVWKVGKRK